MKLDPTTRRTWKTTGLAGLLLAAWLVLTPGCGTDAPKPPETPATAVLETSTSPQGKAKGKAKVEEYDDLKERRAKRRLAAQGPG
jgi:hypothetical protein